MEHLPVKCQDFQKLLNLVNGSITAGPGVEDVEIDHKYGNKIWIEMDNDTASELTLGYTQR